MQHGKIYDSITELIGNTPLVRLNRVVPEGARKWSSSSSRSIRSRR